MNEAYTTCSLELRPAYPQMQSENKLLLFHTIDFWGDLLCSPAEVIAN